MSFLLAFLIGYYVIRQVTTKKIKLAQRIIKQSKVRVEDIDDGLLNKFKEDG